MMHHTDVANTRHYVGDPTQEVWNDRIANSSVPPPPRESGFTSATTSVVTAPIAEADIKEWREQNPSKSYQPASIVRIIRRERLAVFKATAPPENRFGLAERSSSTLNIPLRPVI